MLADVFSFVLFLFYLGKAFNMKIKMIDVFKSITYYYLHTVQF